MDPRCAMLSSYELSARISCRKTGRIFNPDKRCKHISVRGKDAYKSLFSFDMWWFAHSHTMLLSEIMLGMKATCSAGK